MSDLIDYADDGQAFMMTVATFQNHAGMTLHEAIGKALAGRKAQAIATLTAELKEADDTLRVLDIALAETDAALFAREITVIKQRREDIAAALKGQS